MSKFILFKDGVLISRYDDSINTSIPSESTEVNDDIFYKTINDNDGIWSLVDGEIVKFPLPSETNEQIVSRLDAAIENHIKYVITGLGYVSIERLAIYTNSTNVKWKAEALGAPLWITAVWEKAIDVMNDVKAGASGIPTESELIALLPEITDFIQYE